MWNETDSINSKRLLLFILKVVIFSLQYNEQVLFITYTFLITNGYYQRRY